MNDRLANAVSPYLRAHAADPVAWFPWGHAAFAEAHQRDVPVLVSIGYATCHWCHVMARESFRDPLTAAQLNADFVCVKVDREEHPEVDAAFMAAAAAFTRNLGWPLTVFAAPDGGAFHAGTYWPAVARAGVPAFTEVLTAVTQAWTDRRDGVVRIGAALRDALAASTTPRADALPTPAELDAAALTLAAGEDPVHGGFGSTGPKFPIATALRFLQDRDTPPPARAMATRALAVMRASALFDPVDGGFFRYATNADWTEPHYERMLIDNAQLLDVATAEGDEATAGAVAGFLTRVLQQPRGGLGAAQDAESIVDGVPSAGGYFARDATVRAHLDPPVVDDKIVTGWNGLAIGALARYGARFGRAGALRAAERAAACVLADNRTPTGWVRASAAGVASTALATRADLGTLASGLFALAGATGELRWARAAREVLGALDEVGSDPVLGSLGLRSPAASDGDEPSDAAAVADAALNAWAWGLGESYFDLAAAAVRSAGDAAAQPQAFGSVLSVTRRLLRAPRQVVVVGADLTDPLAIAAARIPSDVFACVSRAQARAFADAGFTLFAGKSEVEVPSVFVCDGFTCDLPVTTPDSLPGA